jgi:putative two-component system response regulator
MLTIIFMQETETIKPKTILAIDDNPVNLRSMKLFLERYFEVVPVKSGEEGLRVLRTRKVDLILLDIEMPGMNGFDFLEALRDIPDRQGVPVICVTAHEPTPEFVQGVIKAGAIDIIAKPFDSGTLTTKILKAFHKF